MVDNHYWYTWQGNDQPSNCNAISDVVVITADLNNLPPGPVASWILMLLVAWFTPKGTPFRNVEIDLISQTDGQNFFEAVLNGTNKYRFTTPIVVGHKYMREIKIKTNKVCHYVLQDLTAGTVETHDEPITTPMAITLGESGVEWHNENTAALFPPRYQLTITAFGASTNGGSSYTSYDITKMQTQNDGSGLAYASNFGGLSLNGQLEGTQAGGNGVFYDVPDDTTAPVKLYAGSTVRFGALDSTSTPGALESKTIKTVVPFMSKLGSPTGTIFCRARYTDDTIVAGCEATMDASSLTTTSQRYTFVFPNPQFNFPNQGVKILLEYAGTGSNASNCVQVSESQTDKFDGANTYSTYYTSSYTTNTAKDLCGQLSTSEPPAGTGTPGTGGGSTGSTGGGGGGSVAAGDLRFFYSGGLGNSIGTFSLGGPPSEHEIGSYQLDNLFDNVSDGEAKSGTPGEYRMIYAKNINDKAALHAITLWSPTGGSVSPDTFLYFGLAQAPVNGQESAIASSTTAPPKVSFAEYPDMSKPLAMDDLPPGGYKGIWLWRKVGANARTFSRDQALIEADYYAPPPPVTTGGAGGAPVCPTGYTYDPPTKMCVRGSGGTGTTPLKTGHGVTLMYSTLGGDRYWELMNKSQSNISQTNFKSTLSETGGTKPNVSFKVSSQDQVRIEVGTVDWPGGSDDKSGPTALQCLDTAFLANRGYMATPKDWRNFEAQWYLLVHSYSGSTSSGEAHMELEGRCAYNDTDSTKIGSNPALGRWCESTKYNTNAYFTGRVKFEKCLQHTDGYSSHNPEKTGALNPANWKGRWTGFKCVYYNIPGSSNVRGTGPIVKVEMYADQGDNSATPSNQWTKVIEAQDDGSGNVFSGPRGNYVCGKDHLIPVSWGGPQAVFRWDHLDAEFKWLSIYELDPTIKPAGSGGGPDVVPPLSGGGSEPSATSPVGSARLDYIAISNPSSPTPVLEKVMLMISSNLIQVLTNPENPDNLGLIVVVGNAAYTISGYCANTGGSTWVKGTYGSSPNDEVLGAYWDDANGVCVAPGANSMVNSKKGSKHIVQDQFGPKMTDGPTIFLIFWGQAWSSQTTPYSKSDIETRVRDYLLNRDLIYWSKLSQYGINSLPKWGKSCINTTTPTPSNNNVGDANIQQAIHDSIQRGDVDSPVLSNGNAIYIVICPTSVTTISVSAGNTPSEYSYYQYDSSSSTPGHHDASGGTTTLFQITQSVGPNAPRQLYSGATVRFGWAVNAGSIMLNEDPLSMVGFYLAKGGAPTGQVSFTIRNAADAIVTTMGTLDAANDIVSTTTPELHLLRNEANQYKLQVGDKILCEYSGGSAANYIKVDEMADNGFFDGSLTPSTAYTTSYTQTATKCPAGQLWSGFVFTGGVPQGAAVSSGGPLVPGPPDTIIYDVATTNTPNNMYSGNIIRSGEKIATSSSLLYNQKITQVGIYLKKNGSATGTAYMRLRKGSDDSIACEFGSIDVSTLTTTMTLCTFTNTSNSYTTVVGDRLLIEYSAGDSTNRLAADEATVAYDGTNSISCRYISSYDDGHTGNDSCMRVWISSTMTGGGGTTPGPDTIVYQQSLQNSSISLDSADYKRYGELVNSASSILIGAVITQVDVFLKKTGSPTGNMSVLIRDSSDAIKATFTTTFDVSTLTTSWSTYSFQSLTNTYALVNGDRILLEYSGGDGSNNVLVDRSTSGSGPDSTNTCAVNYTTSYAIPGSGGNDLSGTFWTTGASGGAPPAQPAPFTTVYDVAPSGVSHLSFNSTQKRQGQYIDTGSSLIGKVITRLTLYVDRWSNSSGTLTGAIYKPDGSLAVTMGTINVSSLPNDDKDNPAQFTNTANTYALEKGSFVSIEHSAANGSIDGVRSSGTISNSYVKWNNGSGSWGQSTDKDYAGTMEIGGT